MYYVYILHCADDTLYTGITTDLARRIVEHNSTTLGAKYTASRRPVICVYAVNFNDRSVATKEEMRIKKLTRVQKLELIEMNTTIQ
jgi:putative endonuclease